MLTIYGSDLSGPANKVRFTANYLGLIYEYRRINLREGEQKQEWFLKINPLGKIPAIDDQGFTMYESSAICKYLCDKANSPIYPKDLQQRAIIEQWMDFIALHIGVNMSKVMYNRVFATRMGLPVSQENIADGLKFLDQYLPFIDKQLGKTKYLTGSQMTLADIALVSSLDPSEVAGIDLSPYANIVAWRNGLKSQSFYTKCYKEYGEQLKQPTGK